MIACSAALTLCLHTPVENGDFNAASASTTRRAIDMILAYPDGVTAMSKDIAGLVETSNNLATVRTERGKLVIISNQRSSNMDSLDLVCERILALARLAGAEAEISGVYPSWQPDMQSKLLARCVDVYEQRFGRKPVVEAVHAGLECGIIGARYAGMDMISFGPTIKYPHSPDEKIDIASIGRTKTVVIAGMAGVLLVSHDGGRSFSLVQQGDRKGIAGVLPVAGGGLIAAGEGGVRRLPIPGGAP